MIALSQTMLAVVVCDLGLKLLLRRFMGPASLPMGPFGNVRMVPGQVWVRRLGGCSNARVMWALWAAAAIALAIVSAAVPSSQVFVGLLLGGSLSNALETSVRGTVTDYICLRFWPAFNFADLALTVGGIGTVATLLVAMWGGIAT